MFEAILRQIAAHDTIILHRHKNPDGDALGSQVGLKHIILENWPEKRVYMVGDAAGRYAFMKDSVMDTVADEAYRGALAIVLDTSAKALISDERYEMLITEYEEEQKVLTARLADLEREAEQASQVDEGIDKFTEIVKRNLDFDELTPAILREFVDKIVVHEPVKIDGKRHQNVDIYYSFVGRVDLPAA